MYGYDKLIEKPLNIMTPQGYTYITEVTFASAYFGINVIPNAIPLFSMYDIKNQSVMRMLSCRHILFLTHSFIAWSIRRSSATKSAYRSPFLISSILNGFSYSSLLILLRE